MSGLPDLRPLDAGGRYLLDREGVAYRADDGSLRRLEPIPLKVAARHARADFRFEVRSLDRYPLHPKQAEPLVRDGEAEWVYIPPRETRVPTLPEGEGVACVAHFVGQSVPAVGDTSSGWYALHLPDGSTQVFHGPSVAAHIFRRSV
jgi:hypothetical protein